MALPFDNNRFNEFITDCLEFSDGTYQVEPGSSFFACIVINRFATDLSSDLNIDLGAGTAQKADITATLQPAGEIYFLGGRTFNPEYDVMWLSGFGGHYNLADEFDNSPGGNNTDRRVVIGEVAKNTPVPAQPYGVGVRPAGGPFSEDYYDFTPYGIIPTTSRNFRAGQTDMFFAGTSTADPGGAPPLVFSTTASNPAVHLYIQFGPPQKVENDFVIP